MMECFLCALHVLSGDGCLSIPVKYGDERYGLSDK